MSGRRLAAPGLRQSIRRLRTDSSRLRPVPAAAFARNRVSWPPRTNVWRTATKPPPRAKLPTGVCTRHPQIGAASAMICRAVAVPLQGNPNESPRPYMQPTNLKAIARDAALRGDTKTLIHTLALLERLVPIAAFMDFCTELDELRLQGEPPRPH
jgi:hypothetical protein